MDYFQGVVTEYLRANRAVFVNTECLIQLDAGDRLLKDRHWYCDAMAVNFKESSVYLCEITYSSTMQSLMARLQAWQDHWAEFKQAVSRDSGVPGGWAVQAWVFIPQKHHGSFEKRIAQLKSKPGVDNQMPRPRVTHLESVMPWEYRTWDRRVDTLAGNS